jgi:hypothetical protein
MVALKGLLFALFTLGLTTVISLMVVGVITLMYAIGHRSKKTSTLTK